MSVNSLNASEITQQYAKKEISPVDVTSDILKRAENLNGSLNAFRLIDSDAALAQAKESEARWSAGKQIGPFDGIPISVKDIVQVKGHACLSGSTTTDPKAIARQDCPSVARLREAGAVFIGLTHTPEFGWKGITDSPLHGFTRNPWNTDHSPGGSSGGAGSAVAAGLGPLALGTDAGGSIRIPASYCGITGIKPTFGRVPHAPNESPYATLASVGPMGRTVTDIAHMLTVMSKPDARDWYAAPDQKLDFAADLDQGIKGLKIAYSPNLGGASPNPDILKLTHQAAQHYEELGATVEEVGPVFDPLRPIFEDYWKAGFGYILRQVPEEKRENLDPGFRSLAEEGLGVDIETYYKAASARVALGSKVEQFFDQYDLLITPTMPSTAPRADITYHSPEFDRWQDATAYTVPFNLTGHPGASIPVGFGKNGLPVGLQIVGKRFNEKLILQAAYAYETAFGDSDPLHELIEGL